MPTNPIELHLVGSGSVDFTTRVASSITLFAYAAAAGNTLTGHAGIDKLNGNAGNDVLNGGK